MRGIVAIADVPEEINFQNMSLKGMYRLSKRTQRNRRQS
jgi:hypothetical protein